MTGNAWLCLTNDDYNSAVPSEVLAYYDAELAETTTWAQLVTAALQAYKLPRGPYNVSGIDVWFINLDIDYTSAMAAAITALETTPPFGYVLNEQQVRTYTVAQWYLGTLAQVVAYQNQVLTGEGYTGGTTRHADALESASVPGDWAIPKHPSYLAAGMQLVTELPAGFLPEPEEGI